MENHTQNKQEIWNPEFIADNGDWGLIFELYCRKCGDRVRVFANGWTDKNICSCGYEWSLEIKAVGKKND